ncbi:cytochrome P450 [Pseudonocardia xinjiangensis]|uniref:cytochrome P450 n=1 Tax=Pseudonocardia xinjiangensis TaxID=75289 RepID=UPI003D8C0B7D
MISAQSTTATATAPGRLFEQILDPASRPNPYPLYAKLREQPVTVQDDGSYVVSTYAEISRLLHGPRISSDERKSASGAGALAASGRLNSGGEPRSPAFIFLDPPEHDRLRRLVMRHFTPTRIGGMHQRIVQLVDGLIDARSDLGELDVVGDLAYPLPVAVICELLGVPREDERRFHGWSSALIRSLDPAAGMTESEIQQAGQAAQQMRDYFAELIDARRARPADDLLSALLSETDPDDRMSDQELLSTMGLLLIAGHETTVNLVTNGMLTLLRHPDVLDHLRNDPELALTMVEEILRYDPPVQYRTRTTLADIQIAGTTVPAAATVVLLLASGSRNPRRFPAADSFVPDRTDNVHFGFGGGGHYCVGAPLARMEAQVALAPLARRLQTPRLLAEPPSYRDNAALRGPAHLPVAFDRLRA